MSAQGPGEVPEEIISAMHPTMAQCTIAAQIARQNYDRWYNQAVRASVVTMPRSGILTATGTPLVIRTASDVAVVTALDIAKVDPVTTTRPVPLVPWLDAIAFFIPKSIREPFLGDLREDLEHMAMEHSRASVWCAAISQVAVLALRWAWSSLVRR